MAVNAEVTTQIDSAVKEAATSVLADMGLTISDAIRLMLIKVASEHKLPFDPLIPNEETIEAMNEARRGNLPSFDSVDALMSDLNAPD